MYHFDAQWRRIHYSFSFWMITILISSRSTFLTNLNDFSWDKFYFHRSTCSGKYSSLMCTTRYNEDADKYLKTHSLDNHEQFCLSYILTGHSFQQTLGVAYVGGVCASHQRVKDSRTKRVEERSTNSGFISIEVGRFKGWAVLQTIVLCLLSDEQEDPGSILVYTKCSFSLGCDG